MPIGLTQGLKIGSVEPVDARFVADTIADLTDINLYAGGTTYAGLMVYVLEDGKYYTLIDVENVGNPPGSENAGWILAAGAGGGITSVNGNTADGGNITVGLVATFVGLSASADYTQNGIGTNYPGGPSGYPAISSSFPFYKLSNGNTPASAPKTGSMWIVTGETKTARTSSNGQIFVFVSSSAISGRWNSVTAYSTAMLQAAANNINVQNAQNAQSASTILAYDGAAITQTMPLLMFPATSLDHYDTPYGTSSLAYNPVTGIVNGTVSAATGLQTSNGGTINADQVPYVDTETDPPTLMIPGAPGTEPQPVPITNVIGGNIDYFTSTNNPSSTVSESLSSLQILDYTNGGVVQGISISFNQGTGKLTLQFGTPSVIDASYLRTSATANGTDTWSPNRFNNPDYTYTLYAGWVLGNDTLKTASLWVLDDGAYVKLTETTNTSATSLTYAVNGSPGNNVYGTQGNSYPNASLASIFGGSVGSQTFKLKLTGSNVGGTLHYDELTITKELNKTEPGVPTQTITYDSTPIAAWTAFSSVSTGTTKYAEYGDTGTISHTGQHAADQAGWNPTALTLTPSNNGTYTLGGTTNNIVFRTTSSYDTNTLNTPNFTIQKYATNITVQRKRSLRIGYRAHASGVPAPTEAQLIDVANWSTQYGGGSPFCSSGEIYYNESSNPSSKAVTFAIPSGFGMADLYIVCDGTFSISSIRDGLNNIVFQSPTNVASPAFSVSTVGLYKVYKSTNTLGVGANNTYNFTIYF